jgi:transposase
VNSEIDKRNRNNATGGKYLSSFHRRLLRENLEENLPEQYRQRLEIMLLADEGKTQTEICQILGCCPATARHWTLMASSGQALHWKDRPLGRPKAVDDQYLERLKELVTQSPRECNYPFRHWTAGWLSKHLAKEFGVEISDRHIHRLLKQMGLSTRPKPTETVTGSKEDDRISIRDLQEVDPSEFYGMWSLNLTEINLG